MAQPKKTFAQYAGLWYFPRGSADLTSTTQCPACFSPLRSTVCTTCGLDLNHPAATELATVSTNIADLIEKRVGLIGQIRHETAELLAQRAADAEDQAIRVAAATAAVSTAAAASASTAVAAPVASAARATATATKTAAATLAAKTAAATSNADASAEMKTPRRSSVQVILLIVGVSLLSIAAVFFLVYAYINYGLIWRSVIIGGITVAAFAAASILRRRALRATAEGIGVFAVVLFYLDAFAVRANDFFGTGSANALTYWGTTLLFSAVLFAVWNRLSGLRVASIMAFAVVAPGAGLLLGGLTEHLHAPTRVFVAFAAVATAGLVHRAAIPVVEKLILLIVSFAGYVVAFLVGFVMESDNVWAADVALAALAIIALLHVLVVVQLFHPKEPSRAVAVFTGIFAGAAGATGALVALPSALRDSSPAITILLPAVFAAVVALSIDLFWRRLAVGLSRTFGRVASIAALVVACLMLLTPTVNAVVTIASALGRSLGADSWHHTITSALDIPLENHAYAVLALATVVGLVAGFAVLTGRTLTRRPILIWFALATLLVAVPLLSVRLGVIIGWLTLATAAAVVAIIAQRTGRFSYLRRALISTAIVGSLLAYGVSWGSSSAWLIGSTALVLVLIAVRSAIVPSLEIARSGLLGSAIVVAFVAAGAGAVQLSSHSFDTPSTTLGAVRFVGLAATLVLLLAVVPRIASVSPADRRVAFWMSLPIAVLTGAITAQVLAADHPKPWAGVVLPEFLSSVVASGGLLVALALWTWLPTTVTYLLERFIASLLIAPALCWVAYAKARDLNVSAQLTQLAPIISVAIVVALSLALSLARRPKPSGAKASGTKASGSKPAASQSSSSFARGMALECGALFVGVPAVIVAVVASNATSPTVYLIAAIVLLVWAALRSLSDNRVVRFIASLVIAPAAVWAANSATHVFRLSDTSAELAPIVAVVAVSIWAIALSVVPRSTSPRLARELGIAAIGIPTVISAAIIGSQTSWVVYLLAALTLLLWAVIRSNTISAPERYAASFLVAPTAAWAAYAATRVFFMPTIVQELAPIASVLVVSVVALVLSIVRPTTSPRLARELGIAIIGVPAIAVAAMINSETTWLVLILGALTALILSISADGLFASASKRKHLGWLALALGTAGLWWRLIGAEIRNLEAFVLPVAGALLVIALLIWRESRRRGNVAAPASAPLITLAALLVAVIPLALNISSPDQLRATIVAAACVALLLVGSFVPTSSPASGGLRPYLNGAAFVGALGLIIVAAGRGFAFSNSPGGPDVRLDIWMGTVFALLIAASFGLAHWASKPQTRWYTVASNTLIIVAMVLVTYFELANIASFDHEPTSIGKIRAIAIVAVFALVYVLAMIVRTAPLSRTVGWVAISLAALAFIVGLAVRAIDPLELGTVPIALALIASGAVYMVRIPTARSWAHLAPGLLVLFVPSLLATIGDRPIWRVVAIGVVAIAVIVVGVTRRLQAPFLIGVVVVLIHGIATFAPQLRGAYQALPWWLWAGVGGVLLIVLAARYEHRIKNLKDAALLVSSLR